jgi:hypothetical protein
MTAFSVKCFDPTKNAIEPYLKISNPLRLTLEPFKEKTSISFVAV